MLATAPSIAAKGADVVNTGSCSMSSDWKLKVKPDDGRLEVEFEVDQNRNGQTWNVMLKHNGNAFFSGQRTTKAPSGSFSVTKLHGQRRRDRHDRWQGHKPQDGRDLQGHGQLLVTSLANQPFANHRDAAGLLAARSRLRRLRSLACVDDRQRGVGARPFLDLAALDLERVGARKVGLRPDAEVVDALLLAEAAVRRADHRLDARAQCGHLRVVRGRRGRRRVGRDHRRSVGRQDDRLQPAGLRLDDDGLLETDVGEDVLDVLRVDVQAVGQDDDVLGPADEARGCRGRRSAPTSPVRYQPSSVLAAAVAAGIVPVALEDGRAADEDLVRARRRA